MTNAELRSLIPNVIHEVEGEDLLIDKLRPWLESAAAWLTGNFIGEGYEPSPSVGIFAKKIIVCKAFAEAVPSLDITLSPAGFAVISTDGRAPASKERVERLVASLKSSVDANLQTLIMMLLDTPGWRDTAMGDYWLATFLFGLDDAQSCKRDTDLLSAYRAMRDIALRFQTELEHEYLGRKLMLKLRGAIYNPEASVHEKNLWQMIRRAELRYIACHSRDQKTRCPDPHEIWHLVEPVIREIGYSSEIREIWESEMGDKLRVEPFKNTVKGGFFF